MTDNINSSAAITSPLALEEYAKAVKRLNYHAYLLMLLMVETGIHLKPALSCTISDIQNALSISANGKNFYFNQNNISKTLYQLLLKECKTGKKDRSFFLHENGTPLTKQGFRTVLERVNPVNPTYQLNALSLRKTYYWNLYNRSTKRNTLLRKLQLATEMDAAEYFGVPIEVIFRTSGNSSRAQIYSSTILQDTFQKVETTINTVREEYLTCEHSDEYYDALSIFLTSLDTSVNEFVKLTKDII